MLRQIMEHFTAYLVTATILGFTFLLFFFGNGWHKDE